MTPLLSTARARALDVRVEDGPIQLLVLSQFRTENRFLELVMGADAADDAK